jgi:hypothetical protein
MQVDGMDFLAVKQACKFAKEHVLENGPIVSIQESWTISILHILSMYVTMSVCLIGNSSLIRLRDGSEYTSGCWLISLYSVLCWID